MKRFAAQDPELELSIERLVSAEVMKIRTNNGENPFTSKPWGRVCVGENRSLKELKKDIYAETQNPKKIKKLMALEIILRINTTPKSSSTYQALGILGERILHGEYDFDFSKYAED